MPEPTDERGVPSRMRFAACRSARALSEGVPDTLVAREEHRASIQANLEQVLQFAAPIGPNNRPILSGNGRLVLVPSSPSLGEFSGGEAAASTPAPAMQSSR